MNMQLCRGFTLAEVLVVIALVGMTGVFSTLASLDTYGRSSLRAQRQALIASLEHARAEAVNDVCEGSDCDAGADHGVSIQPDRYVLFQGTSYAARDPAADETVDASSAFAHTGLPEVVFASSSGEALQTGAIGIQDASGHALSITIGSLGQIDGSD